MMHFCLQVLFRVILPPNYSWDNTAYYWDLEDAFLYLESIWGQYIRLRNIYIIILILHTVICFRSCIETLFSFLKLTESN